MKNIRTVPTSLITTGCLALVFLFNGGKFSRPFSITYVYQPAKSQITPGNHGSIMLPQLSSIGSWSSDFLGSHGNTDFLYAMQFDDAHVSVSEAISLVDAYYSCNSTLPADGQSAPGLSKVDGGVTYYVTIFRMP